MMPALKGVHKMEQADINIGVTLNCANKDNEGEVEEEEGEEEGGQ